MSNTRIFSVALATLAFSTTANAGRLVVNHDEWTLSNTGYSNAGAANADRFAKNVAAFLTGGATGNILIRSGNFGLTQGSFLASLGAYTVTTDAAAPLTAANLANYDAVFVGGSYPANAAEETALSEFVMTGGGLYIASGTGAGGAAVEAAAWNAILADFGLSLSSPYNGISGTFPTAFAHPIFSGVTQLYYSNGNSVSDLAPGMVDQDVFGNGLFGVYEFEVENGVPAPAALSLLGLGVAALLMRRR